jgi:hypothetical protein
VRFAQLLEDGAEDGGREAARAVEAGQFDVR